MKNKVTQLPGSEVEIEGELEAQEFEKYWTKAVKHLNEETTLDGFRKGMAPESVLVAKIGETAVLEEMAVMAIEKIYREAIEAEKIDAIGRPEITLVKLARNNPFGYRIKTAVAPEVPLPDYTKLTKQVLAEKEESVDVTDEEVEKVLTDLRESRKGKEEGAEAPALTDEFAQSLGSFKDVADLKEKIKTNMGLEKTERNRQKRRVAILDKLSDSTTIALPRLLLEREADQMLAEMQHNIESMGLEFKEYLARIKKSEEEVRKENEPSAEKRLKVKLILKKIAEAEKLEPTPEEIASEVEKIVAYYKNVNPERAAMYASDVLKDEKVFHFLENLK